MNRYPAWLNLLLVVVLLLGGVLALPNVYGSAPAVQLAPLDGADFAESRLTEVVRLLEADDLAPSAAYIEDGRAVLRFPSVAAQQDASAILGEK